MVSHPFPTLLSSPASPPLRGTGRVASYEEAASGLEQQQNGLALQFARQEMKGDRELCTARWHCRREEGCCEDDA